MNRLRPVVLILSLGLLALTACSDPDTDPGAAAVPPPPPSAAAPVPAPDGSDPVAAVPSATPAAGTATGKPEIATNPDGTVNSGGARPATSESELTAGGLGPYKIGVAQKDLTAAGLVGKVTAVESANCAKYATAKGLAKYRAPLLTFYDGRLLRINLTSGKVRTDKGVTIGTPMAEVKKRYPAGKQIDDWSGRGSWLATVGDFGLLFDVRDDRVAALQAGMTEPMQFKYTDNQGC